MSTARPVQTGLAYPPYLADLVDRAASVLHMHQGRMSAVPFEYWSDGDELQLLASLVWQHDEPAPRVLVHYLRSGDFMCRSMLGDLYAIDPSCFAVDGACPADEIERTASARNHPRRIEVRGGQRVADQ